jgi:hypothetical protein
MVSAATLNASRDVDVRVETARQQPLKNIPEPVLAYRLINADFSVEALHSGDSRIDSKGS